MKRNIFRRYIFYMILASTFLSISCNDSSSNPEKSVKYNLTISNHTNNVFDVYMKQDIVNTGFSKVGNLFANGNFKYENMTIDINYTFRLVFEGQDISSYQHEKVVNSSNTNGVVWDITN